ncbi:MAG TPA: TIGR04222 domain-containing membrane protein, partial [Leptospiraceae bacterium]|nr:TIGR04222 domain-containing membrane protein [Leptospiraceae bacterium]
MNPFHLNGPEFLAFYTGFGAVLLLISFIIRFLRENGDLPKVPLTDPYLFSMLRAGEKETVRLAVGSLLHRNALENNGKNLLRSDAHITLEDNPLEKAVLHHFSFEKDAFSVFTDPDVLAVCRKYENSLKSLQLLPDEQIKNSRMSVLLLSLTALVGLSGIRIVRSIMNGHTNVLFLILLTVFFLVVFLLTSSPRQTVKGRRFLKDLQNTLNRDRTVSMHPGTDSSLYLAAAVLGIGAFGTEFAFMQELYPKS